MIKFYFKKKVLLFALLLWFQIFTNLVVKNMISSLNLFMDMLVSSYSGDNIMFSF